MKSIISILALCAGAAMMTDAAAQLVTSTDDLSNTAAYTISRRSSSNSGLIAPGTTAATVQVGVSSSDESTLWSIHYSNDEKAYYLYNLSNGQFVGAKDGKAISSDTPVDIVPLYVDHIAAWLIDCGGSLLGMADTEKGKCVFLEDYTSVTSRSTGLFFQITKSTAREVTQAESDAIEAKIKAQRPAMLEKYTTFVTKAKALADDGLNNYAGAYDITELEAALANPDKYAISDIDNLYRAALRSKYPQEGLYYVLRDSNRPSTFKNNSLSIRNDGTMASRQQTTPKLNSGTTVYPEGLNLFCVEYPSADFSKVRLRSAATGQYVISDGSNNAKLTLGEKSAATVFTMEPRGEFNRQFRFRYPDKDCWVTISGENVLVNYYIPEEPNYFYFEQVKFIGATPPGTGVLPLTLPCPVTVAETCEALVAVEEADGKVYLEKHEGIIPAGVPFILRSPNGARTVGLTVQKENPEFANDNILVGTNVRVTAPNPHHAITSTTEAISFTKNEKEAVINPNSAYLLSEAAGDLATSFDPRPNSRITEIEADELNGDDMWYDLQGRRVLAPKAGNLYINGTSHRLILVK